MKNLSYEEVIDKIMQIRRFGNLAGVEVSRKMLHDLGNPQKGMKFSLLYRGYAKVKKIY